MNKGCFFVRYFVWMGMIIVWYLEIGNRKFKCFVVYFRMNIIKGKGEWCFGIFVWDFFVYFFVER